MTYKGQEGESQQYRRPLYESLFDLKPSCLVDKGWGTKSGRRDDSPDFPYISVKGS